jgi:hypothetical protein
MRVKKTVIALCFMLAGCATTSTYKLVEPNEVQICDLYSVKPTIQWSQIQKGDVRLWTIDGVDLESIRFFSGIQEGVPIIDMSEEKRETPFRPDMHETELVDAIVDAFTLQGAQQVKPRNLRPAPFGSEEGYRFELSYLDTDGLEKEGIVAGAIVDDSLYLIVYTAAKMHYFPKYQAEVENILRSIYVHSPVKEADKQS